MYDGVHAGLIHSSQPQSVRNAAVDSFRSGATWLLVATDLVGRGMDFLGVQTVISYDFPQSTTDYIHRVGRTGRAGRSGAVLDEEHVQLGSSSQNIVDTRVMHSQVLSIVVELHVKLDHFVEADELLMAMWPQSDCSTCKASRLLSSKLLIDVGEAITFYTEEDAWQLRSIVNVMRTAGCVVPQWMLDLKKERRKSHSKASKHSVAKRSKTKARLQEHAEQDSQ